MSSNITTVTVLKTIIPDDFKFTLPPRKRAKTKEEKEQRRIERIMRNRRAARKSRERKRLYMESIESKLKLYDEIFDLLNIKDQLKEKDPFLLNKLLSLEDNNDNDNDDNHSSSSSGNSSSAGTGTTTGTPNDDYLSKEDHENGISQFYSYISPSSSTVSNSNISIDQDNLVKQETEYKNIEDFFLLNNFKKSNDSNNTEAIDANNGLVSTTATIDPPLFNESDIRQNNCPIKTEIFDALNSVQDSITNSNSLDFLSVSIDWDLMRNPAVFFMITNYIHISIFFFFWLLSICG
ncbi:transcription factor HAC1 PWA37_005031 [Arxiozyma heterogenica]|uniref:transcription factor HAC1 n=1 Tax=Arxiozyma heterogenica TaxID=278026 RepID=UPI002EE3F8BF